ncbi:hypothetical protein V5J35_000920 [Endozoicomonas sp. NE40]|uniref:Uncharacterized protein n=1 Tax=Endozoicomonas lisbonensis TaxID=3120522 RepID=A0ABV2SFK8_9GAMM
MSVKHKVKDRNEKGRIRRTYTRSEKAAIYRNVPAWWVKLFMTRPERRETARLCRKILRDIDTESAIFPLGNRKPHKYYW